MLYHGREKSMSKELSTAESNGLERCWRRRRRFGMKFLWVFHMWNSTGCGSALGDGNVDV